MDKDKKEIAPEESVQEQSKVLELEPGISEEKRQWLKNIGAGEFPEPVKFIYNFNGIYGTNINSNYFLSINYIKNTTLEDLQAQYEENKKFFEECYINIS